MTKKTEGIRSWRTLWAWLAGQTGVRNPDQPVPIRPRLPAAAVGTCEAAAAHQDGVAVVGVGGGAGQCDRAHAAVSQGLQLGALAVALVCIGPDAHGALGAVKGIEHAIARAHPGGGGLDGVAVGIEQVALGQGGDFQPVAVGAHRT